MLSTVDEKDVVDGKLDIHLRLDDCDWLNYKLKTMFTTKDQGILNIEFEYCGANESVMRVGQLKDDKKYGYLYSFRTNIFLDFLKLFLERHIESLYSEHWFNGEDLVLALFNMVLEEGKLEQQV